MPMPGVRTLYRPVGVSEMLKILQSGSREFPPRRPEQPIFYPVLNREYAEQIARGWNTANSLSGYAGFVTRFEVAEDYAARFEEHIVGSRLHAELWVPAGELPEFNTHIVGAIKMVAVFYGPSYTGPIPEHFGLAGCDARQQLIRLRGMREYAGFDFWMEIGASEPYIRMNFPYWARTDFAALGLTADEKAKLLGDIVQVWHHRHPAEHLLGEDEIAHHGSPHA